MSTRQKIKYLEKLIAGPKPKKVNPFLWEKFLGQKRLELKCLKESKKMPIDPYASANMGKDSYRNSYSRNKGKGKTRPERPSNGWCANYNEPQDSPIFVNLAKVMKAKKEGQKLKKLRNKTETDQR